MKKIKKHLSLCLVFIMTILCITPFASKETVSAATYTDVIILDSDFLGSTWYVGDTVEISFDLYSFGNYGQKYYVEIYNSYQNVIADYSGYFSSQVGKETITLTWDTSGKESGTYYVRCYATYSGTEDYNYYKFTFTPSTKLNGKLIKTDGIWYYMVNGKVDKTYVGMAKNDYGWWYLEKGTINFKYTGLAKNEYGTWYMKNGKLDTKFSGKVTISGKTYVVKNGKINHT